jgi:hypothetical protein
MTALRPIAAKLTRHLRDARGRRVQSHELVHFLHVGKCAGTQIKNLAGQINSHQDKVKIVSHPHGVTLANLPDEEQYFFSIRDPIRRFYSGFYSRLRKGKPRTFSQWSSHEARAFSVFGHANDLAEALSPGSDLEHEATAAMKSISHVSMNQVDWFSRNGFFLHERPPVWIVRTEKFSVDVETLLRRLGYAGKYEVSDDPLVRHQNDYGDVPPLSEKAIANLRRWYEQDFAFYRMCETWIGANEHAATPVANGSPLYRTTG